MLNIPTNLSDFFYWLKERTETIWNKNPESLSDTENCPDWLHGAKWIGLKDFEIDEIEIKYKVKFIPEHREFLKILHTIDRKEIVEYKENWGEDTELLTEKVPFFYNWHEDEIEIREKLNWPFETILQDVTGVNKVWLKSWGKMPASEEEKAEILAKWLEKSPQLIPLKSHRFVVSDDQISDRPILSVYGSDIIVYGWDFRHYLLSELTQYLNICYKVYHGEDKDYEWEPMEEVANIFKQEYEFSKNKSIPFWEEMILYWSTGWSSFGKEYPRPDKGPSPIVQAYNPEDEEETQKRFQGL